MPANRCTLVVILGYSIYHIPDSAWSELCFNWDFMAVLIYIRGNYESSEQSNHGKPHGEMCEMVSWAAPESVVNYDIRKILIMTDGYLLPNP